MRDLAEGKALSDSEHHFSDYAQPIFSKWQPILEAAARHRHWVLHGDTSLVYISSEDGKGTPPLQRNIFGDYWWSSDPWVSQGLQCPSIRTSSHIGLASAYLEFLAGFVTSLKIFIVLFLINFIS